MQVGAFAVIRPTAPVAPETAPSQVLLQLGEDKVRDSHSRLRDLTILYVQVEGLYDKHGRVELVRNEPAHSMSY